MSALTISGITSLSSALSLANFTPRIENLPPQCQTVYTTQIAGCQAGDFTNKKAGETCSKPCVDGLVSIMKAVESQCAGVNVPDNSIIGVFLLGLGIPSLCPGIEVVTVSPTSSTLNTPAVPSPTSSSQASTTSAEASSSQTSSEAEATSTSEAANSSGIVIDTTVVPTTLATSVPSLVATESSTSARATSTATSQKSNADSGGGSPFDVVATGSSSSLSPLRSLVISGLVGAFAVALATV